MPPLSRFDFMKQWVEAFVSAMTSIAQRTQII
jgi:hypothetical protein